MIPRKSRHRGGRIDDMSGSPGILGAALVFPHRTDKPHILSSGPSSGRPRAARAEFGGGEGVLVYM
jgi:hypothetical protein